MQSAGRIFFHLVVIAASASIALSLPALLNFAAQNLLVYWPIIGNEKIFLISVEIALAIFLILSTHRIRGSWRNRKISRIARRAGLVQEIPSRSFLARRRIRRWKEKQGFGREVLFMGSTGWRTLRTPGENSTRFCRIAERPKSCSWIRTGMERRLGPNPSWSRISPRIGSRSRSGRVSIF